jgi:DNA-binding response OmpR family regulator
MVISNCYKLFKRQRVIMKKIFIIEDDKKIREELSVFLTKNGYTCNAPSDFDNIIQDAISDKPDLILLDINLPVYDGYYICREIREQSDIPIIVVTSRDSEMDELISMNLGADDFIPKPYNTQILLAHISSVLKRSSREIMNDCIYIRDFKVNLSNSSIEHEGKVFELTKNEMKILTFLYEKRGTIVSRDEIMTKLWNSDMFIDDNTLTVNINRLRYKLEDAGLHDIIETKRGQGYIIK